MTFLCKISNNQVKNTAANPCKTPKQFFPKGANFDLTKKFYTINLIVTMEEFLHRIIPASV